jgi:hypothetical protein
MSDDSDTRLFGEALVALGGHMLDNPNLPRLANINWRYYTSHGFVSGIRIQPFDLAGLVAWVQTLLDVTSEARVGESVFGYVFGHIAAVPVCVWAELPAEAFPSEPGVHEWDVTAQLQEA